MSDLSSSELEDLQGIAKVLRAGNYYEVLNISTAATREDIQKAYYDLARRYHPDRFHRRDISGAEELVEEVFAGINKAFHTLRNKSGRARHDSELKRKGTFDLTWLGREKGAGPSHDIEFSPEPQAAAAPATEQPEASARQAQPAPAEAPAEPKKRKKPRKKAARGGGHEVGFGGGAETPEAAAKAEKAERRKKRKRAAKARSTRGATKQVNALKQHLVEKLAKARRYYRAAQEDMEAERWIKAASSLYLAIQYDERNAEYKRLYEEVKVKADTLRAAQFIAIAENAESYRNIREAVLNYQKAVDCKPDDGKAYFRLGQLLQMYEDDTRGALTNYREAVKKEPRNVRYRMALADLYSQLDMRANAHREYESILKLDPKNSEAKAGARKTRS